MVLITTLVAVLAAAAPLKVAAPGLQGAGFEEAKIRSLGDHLAQELVYVGAKVTTAREIEAAIGLERQRQLLGCSDATCVTEIGNALGVDALLIGDIAKFGSKYQVNLKLVSSANAQTVALFSDRVDSEEALLDTLKDAAKELADQAAKTLDRSLVPVKRGRTNEVVWRDYWWAPAAVGVAGAVVGGVTGVQAQSLYSELTTTPNLPYARAVELRDTGVQRRLIAQIGGGVAVAGLLTAGAMYLFGGPPKSVALLPTQDGFVFAIGGQLP